MAKFKYFELDEFLDSAIAKKKGVQNYPTFEVVDHIEELVRVILDPIREAWGSGMDVSSGFRCQKLNTLIGGSLTSAHLRGYAADIIPTNGKIKEFYEFAENYLKKHNVAFDQSIREKDSKGNEWWHIGLYSSMGTQRRQYKALEKK